MNKIIIPTGYMSSGSSAVTDLISEFDGFEAAQGKFEYVFLHCPNGVFDLEDKLLIGNNAVRSDEALHSFRHTMKQLYDKKYWWVGHYKEYIGHCFWDYTQEYIQSLVQFKPDFYWYYQENCDKKMIEKLIIRRLVRLLTLGKVELKKPLLYDDLVFSYVTPDEFYAKTREYLQKIWDAAGLNKGNIILDQLLLPFNLFRFPHYFKDNAEVFVVERDPRDVFILNKYFSPALNDTVPYPTQADQFADCYKRLRAMEKPADYVHIHRIRFEDLIYRYEETVEKIRTVLDVKAEGHSGKKSKFIPEKSIRNTQLFLRKPDWTAEVEPITAQLSEYLYDFPYPYCYDGGETF